MADDKGKKPQQQKTQKKPNKRGKVYKNYVVKGSSLEKKGRFCLKCGPGFLMANHKTRTTCGNCGYTEFNKKEK